MHHEIRNCRNAPYVFYRLETRVRFGTHSTSIRLRYVAVEDNMNIFCSFIDERDCRFMYTYAIDHKTVVIKALQNKECPPQANILGTFAAG